MYSILYMYNAQLHGTCIPHACMHALYIKDTPLMCCISLFHALQEHDLDEQITQTKFNHPYIYCSDTHRRRNRSGWSGHGRTISAEVDT